MKKDVFPATMSTWIGDQLRAGDEGRSQVNHHIMAVYYTPIRTYFLGTGDRWLGEPDEIVQGFFADRLDRDRFFADWQRSGMPLRRWLVNAFCFYLKEMRRRRWRDGRAGALVEDPVTFSGDPEAAVDRAFVVSVVQRALEATADQCISDGLSEHWQIFDAHFCRGRPYALICEEFGVDRARAAVMARTATRKFRVVLRDLLSRDGDSDDLDSQIKSLLGTIS